MIVQTFWLFLPAGVANMAPVIFKWVPLLDYPMDGGRKWRGKRILGNHKTWRGFSLGIIAATGTVALQQLFADTFINISPFDYSTVNVWALGFALGFGAMAGDAVESFVKRRQNIAPGKPWVPWDQIDWIVGAVLMVLFAVNLTLGVAVLAVVMFGLLHPLINLLGYELAIKKNKF